MKKLSLREKLKQVKPKNPINNLKLIMFGDSKQDFINFPVSKDLLQYTKIKNQIEIMKNTANYYALSSLSSNQVGLDLNAFIINKKLQYGQWIGDKYEQYDYELYMNPVILEESDLLEYDWEFCGSFPGSRSRIKRPTEIKLEYMSEFNNFKTCYCKGFLARVIQHEISHLNGQHIGNYHLSQGSLNIGSSNKNLNDRLLDLNSDMLQKEFEKFQKN